MSKSQGLVWPQLLYALAMVASKGDLPLGVIWVEVPDENHLKLHQLHP